MPSKQQWEKILDRALQIPDIVADQHREEARVFAVYEMMPQDFGRISFTPDRDLQDIRSAITAFVDWLVEGGLDDHFVRWRWTRYTDVELVANLQNKMGLIEQPGRIRGPPDDRHGIPGRPPVEGSRPSPLDLSPGRRASFNAPRGECAPLSGPTSRCLPDARCGRR